MIGNGFRSGIIHTSSVCGQIQRHSNRTDNLSICTVSKLLSQAQVISVNHLHFGSKEEAKNVSN